MGKRISYSVLPFIVIMMYAFAAGASDYKPWIPLLPQQIGGLKKKGKHEGMNMEMDSERWSSLTQTYGSEECEKEITLTIVCGSNAPQIMQFNSVPKIKIETEDQVITDFTFEGKRGFLTLDKNEKNSFLMFLVEERLLITIEMQECCDKDRMISLLKEIPLQKFKCQVK